MINIKNCFIAVICVMLATPPIFANAPGCSCEKAIRGKDEGNMFKESVVGVLSKIFISDKVVEDKNKTKKENEKEITLGILDDKIDVYEKNFYKWYGKNAFKESTTTTSAAGTNQSTLTKTLFDKYGQEALKTKCDEVDKAVNTELQEYIKKSLSKPPVELPVKIKDESKLVGVDRLINQTDKYTSNTPDSSYPEMLNPIKMLEINTDTKDSTDKVNTKKIAAFITSLEDSLSPFRRVYLPSKEEIEKTADNKDIKIIVPMYNENNGMINTIIPINKKTYTDKIKTQLEDNSLYQANIIRHLSDLSIRCSLMSNIIYMVKKREVSEDKGLSLAEKEKNMALEGLDPKYYGIGGNSLSIADLNLKTLHANNKTVYFMYRILQQLEYANYIQSLKSLQEQQLTVMTDDQNIMKIKSFIEAKTNPKP